MHDQLPHMRSACGALRLIEKTRAGILQQYDLASFFLIAAPPKAGYAVRQFSFNKSKPSHIPVPGSRSHTRTRILTTCAMPRGEVRGRACCGTPCHALPLSLPEWSNLTFWEITVSWDLQPAAGQSAAGSKYFQRVGRARESVGASRHPLTDDLQYQA